MTTTKLSFDELCALEPWLRVLERAAKSYRRSKAFCANAVWYGDGDGGLRRQVQELVGWLRPDKSRPELTTQAAYDVAYEALYAALPDCGSRCACGALTAGLYE